MFISYASVILDAATPELSAWIEATLSTEDVFDFVRRTWSGPGVLSLGMPGIPRARKVKTETLWWPRGAANFAVGYYVCNQTQLAAIRTAVYNPNGTQYLQQNLVLNDGQYSLTAPMWMLPARPLQQIPLPSGNTSPSGGDLFLLTLVDSRFFWWIQAAQITVTVGATTWAQLFASIATALTTLYCPVLRVDPVPAAYLLPTADFATSYQSLPLLLDAATQSCGLKIVVDPTNGNVRAMNAVNAAILQETLLTEYSDDGPYYPGVAPLKIAGGKMALTNLIDAENISDLNADVPNSVTVTFPQYPCIPTAVPAAIPVTLASLIVGSPPALPEFAGVYGFPGSKTIPSTQPYVAANVAALTVLAQQTAVDYYRWSASRLDLKMYGMLTWNNDALSWSVEWTSRTNEYSTRIQRPPWNDAIEFQPVQLPVPLIVQHNDTQVGGPEPILDFEDPGSPGGGNVQFIVIDDPSGCRHKVGAYVPLPAPAACGLTIDGFTPANIGSQNPVPGNPITVPGVGFIDFQPPLTVTLVDVENCGARVLIGDSGSTIGGPVGPGGPGGPPGSPGAPGGNSSNFIDCTTGINWRWACNTWYGYCPCQVFGVSGSGSGSFSGGSGSGGGGGPTITTACCPGVQLPTTIHLTLTNFSANCSCLQSVTLKCTWNVGGGGVSGYWQSDSTTPWISGCCDSPGVITLLCPEYCGEESGLKSDGPQCFVLTGNGCVRPDSNGGPITPTLTAPYTPSCDPFHVTFKSVPLVGAVGSLCPTGGTADFIFTV